MTRKTENVSIERLRYKDILNASNFAKVYQRQDQRPMFRRQPTSDSYHDEPQAEDR